MGMYYNDKKIMKTKKSHPSARHSNSNVHNFVYFSLIFTFVYDTQDISEKKVNLQQNILA